MVLFISLLSIVGLNYYNEDNLKTKETVSISSNPKITTGPKPEVITSIETNEEVPTIKKRIASESIKQEYFYGMKIIENDELTKEEQIELFKTSTSAIKYRLRRDNPLIKKIRILTVDKVLKSDEDLKEILDLHTSEKIISDFSKDLAGGVKNHELYRDDLMLRSYKIDFFEKALANKDNFRKNEIIDQLVGSFLSDNIDDSNNMETKKTLVFEKIQIAKMLNKYSDQSLSQIEDKLVDLKNKKIIRYALDNS